MFQMVQQVTGCGPIGCFTGRVYRMLPGPGHYDSWHTDAIEHRIVGMSVNLGRGMYTGGVFQLRELRSQKLLSEVANTGPGDAILFRISPDLAHRVTPVGAAPTVVARIASGVGLEVAGVGEASTDGEAVPAGATECLAETE